MCCTDGHVRGGMTPTRFEIFRILQRHHQRRAKRDAIVSRRTQVGSAATQVRHLGIRHAIADLAHAIATSG
eukprot:6381638-Pyramimonas_sp.AAC.3